MFIFVFVNFLAEKRPESLLEQAKQKQKSICRKTETWKVLRIKNLKFKIEKQNAENEFS